jgi:polysaccharide pyruvyl transferase WcaK-like protein
MKILVIHAWLKGNLGDVLQLSVLLDALRQLKPRVLDLAGFPARPAEAASDVVAIADRYLGEPFPWYWQLSPRLVGKKVLEPMWSARRRALFSRYDAIVCAPGPYLADFDARAPSALCDITVAAELGLPVVLASHSIGPLNAEALLAVRQATVRIAREPSTCSYLQEQGLSCVRSADLAFLYPYARVPAPPAADPRYRLVFLRSNNLSLQQLRLQDSALYEGPRLIAEPSPDRLVLATSDCRRDERFLRIASRRLGVSWVGCRSVPELVRLISASSGVVSDRYHPAICAAALGKPAQVVMNREPHKMRGLTDLLAGHGVGELQELARTGLSALHDALRSAR